MGNSLVTTTKGVDAMIALKGALEQFYAVPAVQRCIDPEHTGRSPERIAEAYAELYQGCFQDPKEMLKTKFSAKGYDEIIWASDIKFVSMCAHHGLPFFGKMHFAYMPKEKIVGLSKIPRLIQVLARRPQVQEKLTMEIVDTFWKEMKPKGCGLVVEGYHLCMMIRGVKSDSTYTRTNVMRGNFRNASIKAEFLDGVRKTAGVIWP